MAEGEETNEHCRALVEKDALIDTLKAENAALKANPLQETADETMKEAGAEEVEAVDAVESYRAARATPWGAELPKPFLRDLLHCLKGQRGWRGSRFRLVCAGWQAAHDEQCTRLQLNIWNPMPALPCLERVTEVDVLSVSEAVRSRPKGHGQHGHQYDGEVIAAATLHLHLAKLRGLPSLTNLTLDIPVLPSPLWQQSWAASRH
jgi:hypothetical protein